MLRCIVALIVGAAVPAAVYQRAGWWLDTSEGFHLQSVLLFAAGAAVSIMPRRARPAWTWWAPAAFAAIGAIAASTALLFRSGPGTIFPIVLAFAAIICTLSAFAGAALVAAPALWQRRTRFAVRWRAMLIGAATFLVVGFVIPLTERALFGPHPSPAARFVGSGAGGALGFLAFCVIEALLSRAKPPSSFGDDMLDALAMAAGAGAPMLVRLVAVLHVPADVVPVVLALGLIPLVAGSAVGAVFGRAMRTRP